MMKNDKLVNLKKTEELGCIAFDRLVDMNTQGFCKACGNKTMFHLVDAGVFFSNFNLIYPCCDEQDCYDQSVQCMQEDYYLFASHVSET